MQTIISISQILDNIIGSYLGALFISMWIFVVNLCLVYYGIHYMPLCCCIMTKNDMTVIQSDSLAEKRSVRWDLHTVYSFVSDTVSWEGLCKCSGFADTTVRHSGIIHIAHIIPEPNIWFIWLELWRQSTSGFNMNISL